MTLTPRKIEQYHVFLASPGDMNDEREAVRQFFIEFNSTLAHERRLEFIVIDWENYSDAGVGRPQDLITQQTLSRYQSSLALVIGLMGQKFGSPTGTNESGTEEEFEWALDSHIRTAFPEIKWFFKDIKQFIAPPDSTKILEAAEQWEKAQAFRKRLEEGDAEKDEPQLLYKVFTDLQDFRDVLRKDLSRWLIASERPWSTSREIEPYQIDSEEPQVSNDNSREFMDQVTDVSDYDENAVINFPFQIRPQWREEYATNLTPRELLGRLNLIENGFLTYAGVLLFGRNPNSIPRLRTAIVQCTYFSGTDVTADRRDSPEFFAGRAPSQIDEVMAYISENIRHKEGARGNAQSTTEYEYPMECVREIVANALAHRDYEYSKDNVHVNIFSNKIEISSPGRWVARELEENSPIPISALKSHSIKRNYALARVLTLMRYVEAEGSGIPRAIKDCENHRAPLPTAVQEPDIVTLTIYPIPGWATSNSLPIPESQALELPTLFVGVPQMPAHFVGRDDLMENMAQRLILGDAVALSAEGKPGVGKTTLAIALAHNLGVLGHFSDGILWAGLGPQPDEMSILGRWADALGIDVSGLPTEAERSEVISDAIGQKRMLIVIDDAWQIEAANVFKCGGPNCVHLLTTRNVDIANTFAGASSSTAVPVLEDDPAYDLLRGLAPDACAADPDAARQLARSVDGLPLALELLGGYLAKPDHSLFPELSREAIEELGDPKVRLQLAQERLGARGSGQVTLRDTIALSLEGLPDEAKSAFYALGAFAPKPEQFDLGSARKVVQTDSRTIALLIARSLVEKDGDSLALHQTIADVARQNMTEDAQTRHREHYLALANEDIEDWRRIAWVYGQIRWAWDNAQDSEELLDLVWALQTYQRRRGVWQEYIEWANRSLKITQEIGLREDEGKLLNNIGLAYDSLGQRKKALEYYNQSLTIRKEMRNRAGMAQSLNNIGSIYDSLGQREKALEYFNRALPIRVEVGDRAGMAATLNNIGSVYDSLGQREKALDYFNRILPILEAVGDRAGLATTLSNIGTVYDSLGQREKALDYFNQALPIRGEVGDKAGMAGTLNNIGLVYDNLGQGEKALDYYNQVLPITEEVGDMYGESITRYNIALIYRDQGRLAEAVAELKQVVELAEFIQSPQLEVSKATLAQVEAELLEQEAKGG